MSGKRYGIPLAVLVTAITAGSAHAQIASVERTSVASITRLTFGHLCEDTFVLRNDGEGQVNAALSVARSGEQVPMPLAAKEQVQFSSKSREDVELWVDGKLVAKAEKDRRKCSEVRGNASVAVAPLEVQGGEQGRATYANYPYVDPWFYSRFGPAWGYPGWGAYGWGYRGYVGVPIIIGVSGRGGPPRGR